MALTNRILGHLQPTVAERKLNTPSEYANAMKIELL